MLDWASAVFNTSGPLATDGEEEEPDILTDLALRDDALRYLLSVDAQHLRPGSWSDALFQAVHAGKLELGEARAALSGLVVPSLDTTILSKANLLYNLGLNRHYWDMLRANPKLIPSAVLEGVRYSAVVRWFSRVAVRDYEVGGFTIPAGSRVSSFTGRPIAMNGNMACRLLRPHPQSRRPTRLGNGTTYVRRHAPCAPGDGSHAGSNDRNGRPDRSWHAGADHQPRAVRPQKFADETVQPLSDDAPA